MPITKSRMAVQEADGSPVTRPNALKFPNGTLTDNGDGTTTYTPAASGGQTTYDAIVAASGGTHTTLAAAITAASAGWRILVLDGTTESGSISTALANLTIVGASPYADNTIAMGTNSLTLSGGGIVLENLNFTFTTGSIAVSGSKNWVNRCRILMTGSNTVNRILFGSESWVTGNYITTTDTDTTSSARNIKFNGENYISGNYFLTHLYRSNNIDIGSSSVLTGNTFQATASGTATNRMIYCSDNVQFSNNRFIGNGDFGVMIFANGSAGNRFTGNYFSGGRYQIELQTGTGVTAGHSITGNTFYQCGVNGVRLAFAHFTTVTGNYFNRTSAGSGNVAVYVATNDNVVSGNTINSHVTGIELSGTAVRNAITGNAITQCTNNFVFASHNNTVTNNVGQSPVDEKVVQYVKNTSGGSITAGWVVVLKAVAAGNEVTTTTNASDPMVYGVMIETVANNGFGSVQVIGKTTLLKVDGTTDIAIGDYLTTFTTAGIAAKAAAGNTAFAIALEAYTTDDSSGTIDALIIRPRII